MKHFVLFIAAFLSCLTGIAQGGYDPENPGDPNSFRKLTVLASPKAGGSAHTNNDSQVGVGQTVSCYANESNYYDFVHWLKNGEIVSTESYFSFVMPDEDVEMIAVFELNYDPHNPDDPQEVKPSHRVTITASPGRGGYFNNSVFRLYEGDSTNIYAYSNNGYQFEEWLLDGVLVSTKNPLMIKMTDKDLHYTAKFSYNPISPTDPAVNLFKPGTGEMVVDKFEKGNLSNAIYQLLNDDYDYSHIQSLLVCGMMDGSDFGVMYRLSNCSVMDLSRTNGYTEIPSYAFDSSTSLTELSLPSCINAIGRYAFANCENLSVITCYAPIPPSLSSYGVFNGVDKSVVIKVPSQSIDLYKNAQGWKDFTILPADENVFSISVSLPSDANDGRYKNMSIELLNTTNGQRYKYLITDKTEYIFNNLLSATKYSVYVKNSKNEILGEISDLEIVDKDLTTAFQSLRQPQNVSLKVITPDGDDITLEVTIKWFNDAKELLSQGSTISGVLENSVISYIVSLPQDLLQSYLEPSSQSVTVANQNTLTCTLEEIGKSILKGKVCDTEGKVIQTAVITVSQNINGTYTNSQIAQCNDDGIYELEVPDVPLKVTISANGYIGQTKELQTASTGVGDIVLERNTGITIYPSYTFQQSVLAGQEEQLSDRFVDDSNIAYRIEDLNGNEIVNCLYQSGSIILPDNIKLDDKVNVVAYSKNKRFNEVTQTEVISSKKVYVELPIVEYGGIRITTNDDATNNTCLLYDVSGKQVGTATFRGGSISFGSLPDGEYTIISMRESSLLGSVSSLSSFQETQLEQGRDYLLNKTHVVSGEISDIAISEIPALDETKLYYTNSKETYFMSNKSQLTIGNYVTLKAKLTIKDEYAKDVETATLIVDIPSNCEFVNNSVISGSGYLGYEYASNRLSIPIQNLSDAVRFCIVPLEGGDCKPSAFIKLVIDNEEILQPIGSAYFKANNFSLSAPQKTSKTDFAIRGTATSNSEVLIYDNETLVGSTYSMPNGQWAVSLSLHKPYTRSLHNIYGEVIAKDGKRLLTQTKTVDYDQSYVDLSKVTMVYNNNNIIFNHLNGTNTANSYSYVSGVTDFTFIADFTENNPEKISNVIIKVLASDGSVRSLPAEFNPTSGNWMVRTKYANSDKLPTNVTAEFEIKQNSKNADLSRHNDDMKSIIYALHNQQTTISELSNNFNIVEESENIIVVKYYNKENNSIFYVKIERVNYEEYTNNNSLEEFIEIQEDSFNVKIKHEITKDNYYLCVLDCNTNELYQISLFDKINYSNQQKVIPAMLLGGAISIAYAEFSRREFEQQNETLNDLYRRFYLASRSLQQKDKELNALLNARCEDGSNKISIVDAYILTGEINRLKLEKQNMEKEMETILSDCQNTINLTYAFNIGLSVTQVVIGAASTALNFLKNIEGFSRPLLRATTVVLSMVDGEIGNQVTEALLGNCVDRAEKKMYNDFVKIGNSYLTLTDKIKSYYKECPKNDDEEDKHEDDESDEIYEDDEFPTPPVTPVIDPSGYVYEAVPSNRIPGVTTTAYYKQQVEDMYGDITETAVVWDAVPFGQTNPLITDKEGKYAWDVPAGMWQVRFEKEGYEPAQSEWLPVPPPQLEVNIAMTQVKQPEVKTIHAYSDGVTIEFDKFMLPSSLSVGNISITQNGNVVSGTVETVDMELNASGNAFCSKIEFKPNEPLAEGEAILFISKSVKSYSNVNMSEDFVQTFTVEPRISEIKVQQSIEVNCGSTIKLFASLLPATAANGKTVLIESLNPMVASVSSERIETDENGMISFDVSGLILGRTGIKLSVEDYDIETVINVNVIAPRDESQVATPYASVESGEVEAGTEIHLYCETENASIYYTVDGSCPCDVNRRKYDGTPIIANKDFTLKIMAEAEGLIESDIAEYEYTVNTTGIGEIPINNDLSIYPLLLGEYLNVTNGGKLIDSVSLFDLNGKLILHSDKSAKQISLKVGFLTPGIYVLNIKTNGQSVAKKVIKR